MKKISLIGIGAGHPEYLTLQAIEAMRRAQVFFFLDKDGPGKDELIALRRTLIERAVPAGGYRLVAAPSPTRARHPADYHQEVDRWRQERVRTIGDLITRHLAVGETGAFLIWGDPCLYDGTIDALHQLAAEGVVSDFDVFPGISSLQALAARHRLPLNRVAENVTLTTGRRLATVAPEEVTNSVVVLDGLSGFQRFKHTDLEIYWGAYLGTPDEILISGKLSDCADRITQVIERERTRKGWLMDVYLLRKP